MGAVEPKPVATVEKAQVGDVVETAPFLATTRQK
jgi:hypothetical protein